jgi:hypothetical protein
MLHLKALFAFCLVQFSRYNWCRDVTLQGHICSLQSSPEVGDHIGRNPLFAKLKGISQHLL